MQGNAWQLVGTVTRLVPNGRVDSASLPCGNQYNVSDSSRVGDLLTFSTWKYKLKFQGWYDKVEEEAETSTATFDNMLRRCRELNAIHEKEHELSKITITLV